MAIKKAVKKVLGKVVKPVKKDVYKPTKLDYQLEVQVNGKVFKGEAINFEECLKNFVNSSVFPVGAKTLALIKYNNGKVYRQRVLHTPEARRLFRTISLKPNALALLAAKLTQDLG